MVKRRRTGRPGCCRCARPCPGSGMAVSATCAYKWWTCGVLWEHRGAPNKIQTPNTKRRVCAVGWRKGGERWWGRGREIFIKIEHRLLRSGLDLTLLSLPWTLFHSSGVDLQSSREGGNYTSLGKEPLEVFLEVYMGMKATSHL